MVVADLHVHTTRSDGSLAPERVAGAARRADLEAVAITDHDRLPPGESSMDERAGVTVIGGIELRVTTDDQRLDLLGYGIEPTDDLRAELERLQRDRIERARAVVSRVEDHIGVDLDVSFDPGVGRPHVAHAIAESDAPYGYDGAFENLIGDDGPCYVAREITPYERGRELLAGACDLVSLAHPLRYDDPDAALSRAGDLGAVELVYPYEGTVDLGPVEAVIAENDLLATGGSDAHDERLGVAGLDDQAYERVRDRLSP
ncbi:PHP domain-containing protein [Halorhabdus amylolytica]|uniref:PHP domain-containing protein n=1 Tax=Halorhabdus amylolytica TaxID=2559573 RepID=UPI0010A9BFAF|nr:PHP domain-containing protein [Halorhabdus amylolytica]